MGRNKKYNGNVGDVIVAVPMVSLYKTIELLKQYNISYESFCEIAKIADNIIDRVAAGDYNFELNTLLAIVKGLNKVNQNRRHYLSDILEEYYEV